MTTPRTNKFLIPPSLTIKQSMRRLAEGGGKVIFIVDQKNKLLGSLSDGDIRKWILKGGNLEALVDVAFNPHPRVVQSDFRLEDVRALMLSLKIECVPVVDGQGQVLEVLTWDEVFAGKVERHREKLDIPVVIMAGGQGSRLDPFTKILPKPLIPIGEKPIIELIMDKFMPYEIKEFYISVFHKARMIKSYFEEEDKKYRISYLEEEKPLGTVGSLRQLHGRVKGALIVTNCDVIIDCDYAELVHFHNEKEYDLTLVVSMRHFQIPYGVCELEAQGALKTIKEKPEYDFLVNTGMYVLNGKVLDLIPKNRASSIIDLIDALRAKSGKIGVFPINEKSWIDIGQWEEYKRALKMLGA